MNRTILIVVVIVLALALGIGGGYVVSKALPAPLNAQTVQPADAAVGPGNTDQSPNTSPNPSIIGTPQAGDTDGEDEEGIPLPPLDLRRIPGGKSRSGPFGNFGMGKDGMGWMREGILPPGLLPGNQSWPDQWRYWGPQGMGPWGDENEVNGTRITAEKALEQAQAYITGRGDTLRVASVSEFENAFYAVVTDTGTGKGAMELLIQPVSGRVRIETGPCMNWNTRYGRLARSPETSSGKTLSMADAAAKTQQVLDKEAKGVTINTQGIEFPGYYTFEYQVNGEVAGLLSVNAETGNYWFHNWLGKFISKQEIVK